MCKIQFLKEVLYYLLVQKDKHKNPFLNLLKEVLTGLQRPFHVATNVDCAALDCAALDRA